MSKNDYNSEVEALFGLAHREFFQYQRGIEPLLEAIANAAEIDKTLQTEHQSPVHHQCQELMGLTMARDIAKTRPQYTRTFYERCEEYAAQFPAAKDLVEQMEKEDVDAPCADLCEESKRHETGYKPGLDSAVRATRARVAKIAQEHSTYNKERQKVRPPSYDAPGHKEASYIAALETVMHNIEAVKENPDILEQLPTAIRKIVKKKLERMENAR